MRGDGGSSGTSLAELSGFLEIIQQQADRMEAKLDQQRMDAEAKLGQTEAKLQAQLLSRIQEQEIVALQARLENLHTAKGISDEELFAFEDIIADALEAPDDDDRVSRMVALSARMVADASFIRQLRRKFIIV